MSYTNGLDKPTDYFNTVLYTGNGSTNAVTGVGFSPNFVWIKERNSTSSHSVSDTIRGTTKRLNTDLTVAEETLSGVMTSFDSDGFTNGADNGVNESGKTYVSWNWLAGVDAGSSNTDGSITSTVSANTTSGFSIVSYTGSGSNATVGHELGSLPGMVIVKGRNTTATNHWFVFHKNSQSSYSASGSAILLLNETNAVDTIGVGGVWNNTSPTSSVFNIGTENGVNESGKDFIAYCFAEKKGYSKFGSYTGNGNADGTFVYTGFKPAWLIVKSTSTNGWTMFDNKRNGFNVDNDQLIANTSGAETDGATDLYIDLLSNGFKFRNTATDKNSSGQTYIYMAFAESPFVNSNGVPTNAR
jgi:hypothetical protein